MNFHLPSLQPKSSTQVAQDYAQRAMLYVSTGALSSRVSPLSVKDGFVIGLINSACVQFSHSIVKTNERSTSQLLVSMCAMAISTLLMASLAGRVGLHLSVRSGIALALLNGFGEFAKIVILPAFLKDFNKARVRHLHQNYEKLKKTIDAKSLPSLHARFYELDLPLPENKTFKAMHDANESFHITELPLPKTPEKAEALTRNQCSWLAFSLLQHKGVSKLDFNTRIVLRQVMAQKISFFFYVHPKSVKDVKEITDPKVIRMLHTQYTQNSKLFQTKLNNETKKALDEIFTKMIQLSNLKTLESMEEADFKKVYDHVNKYRINYLLMPNNCRIAFNKKISKFKLSTFN